MSNETPRQSSSTKCTGDWNLFLKKAAQIINPIWEKLAIELEFTSANCSEFKTKRATGIDLPTWWPAFRMLLAWKNNILSDTRISTDSSVLTQLKDILTDAIRPLNHEIAEQFSREL